MTSKVQFYSAMASYTATHLTDSWQRWTAFLTTASRLYKYPFHEQLMIFAQRPDATACAEYDLWNDTMRRYVRRGSKGIALVDNSRENPRLRYVFDISDTGLRKNSRHPFLWELRPEHEAAVAQALTERFGAPPENNLAEQFESIAAQLVSEYWVEHKQDILDIVDGSFLEGYDEFNLLACSRQHIEAVFEMLGRQKERPAFTGGLEARLLRSWHVDLLRESRTQRMYFAYDTPDDYEPLVEAGRLLQAGGFERKSHKACCYVLIGYRGDTMEAAEKRLRDAWKAGFIPYAMLYRDEKGIVDSEWRKFQRLWVRPAIVMSQLKESDGR